MPIPFFFSIFAPNIHYNKISAMTKKTLDNVIIEHDVTNLSNKERKEYQEFIYCSKGTCQFCFNETKFTMKEHTCTIILSNRFLSNIKVSEDFECDIIYIEQGFLRQSEPNNPYIIQGTLSLYANPVMVLNEKEEHLCQALFENFKKRLEVKEHTFYNDILRTSARMLVLDLFDIHAKMHKGEAMSQSGATIMTKFIAMLHNREYRKNREVAYYAEQLCVVPKYLSEISNKISGYSASYWINRYTSHDINELLRENTMTPTQIAKMFHFTSTSYFNRYVKRYLGSYPSELRGDQ